jgi:hypothetical protein
MSSWADEANGESSVDQENFKAEFIISQTPDGREKVKITTFISSIFRVGCAQLQWIGEPVKKRLRIEREKGSIS